MGDQAAQQKIEAYLARLRHRLRGMNREDVREIEEELRTHIKEKATASEPMTATSVDAALISLGSPDELAREYLTDYWMIQAEVSRSPWRVLDSMFRWASLSAIGFVVLLGSVLGYFVGAAFILCAALKPLHPQAAGLWLFANGQLSLRMGFGNPPTDGRDLLGWWIVPIGFTLGCGLVTITTRFALWCARQFRKSRKESL